MAAEEAEKAVSDIDRAIKESAKRTAAKQATIERAEAQKAREKVIALKEAADKAACGSDRKSGGGKEGCAGSGVDEACGSFHSRLEAS